MKLNKFTRYFLFTRVDPKEEDYTLLLEVCKRIDAHLGYRTILGTSVDRLVGFIVLRGPRTFVADLCRLFPNFNLTPMSDIVELGSFDFDNLPKGTVLVGDHPFKSIRSVLFPDGSPMP